MIAQLLNYDPYRELDSFSRRLFSELERPRRNHVSVPVDIRDEGDKFVVQADLPGVQAADLEIVAAPDKLTLKGQRKAASDGKNALHRERGEYSFERSFHLPKGIELDGVEAKLEGGVLTVTLPKRAGDQPRTIAVKAA